jgi:hypothetical protein
MARRKREEEDKLREQLTKGLVVKTFETDKEIYDWLKNGGAELEEFKQLYPPPMYEAILDLINKRLVVKYATKPH